MKVLKVLGHRVLVEVDVIEEKSDGGIILKYAGNEEKYRQANSLGTVVDVGETAYKDVGTGEPWCKIGDHVYFQKYGGIIVEEDGKDYRILNDEDILAIKS